jgi:hypothetical protein
VRPYLKKTQPTLKRAGEVAQVVDPEFKSQYGKKIIFFASIYF